MEQERPLIRFRLDQRSGLPAYQQLFDQVASAIRRGLLRRGDQLPSVREVVAQVSVNPNTVHRAYRELEGAGLAEGRPGSGTFVSGEQPEGPGAAHADALYRELVGWIERAARAGLGPADARELFTAAMAARHEEATIS